MQTLAELMGTSSPHLENPQVAAYFEVLQQAQRTYLDAVAAAGSALPEQAEHLREAAALQGRLTRRWFDAQRAILEQRRAVDARAAACVDGMTFLPPSGIDGGRFERQLDALLDEWWRTEQRACAAASFEMPAFEAVDVSDSALPPELAAALESADPAALARLLDDLVADLDAHLAVAAATTLELPAPRPGDLVLIGTADDHDERFRAFWADPAQPTVSPLDPDDEVRGNGRRAADITTKVVLPMVAVTSGFALVLALLG